MSDKARLQTGRKSPLLAMRQTKGDGQLSADLSR